VHLLRHAKHLRSPEHRDLLGRNVSMSMWALRVPGLAFKSRHGLGDLALIILSTAMHAFICRAWGGREKKKKTGR
jgi:hypothetical protein